MTSEELAAAGVSSTGKRFTNLRTFNLKRITQSLTLPLIMRIMRTGRSDLRVHLVLKKISQMLMLTPGNLLQQRALSHTLHPSSSANLKLLQI
jgi:hypothetical protein